LSDTKDQLPAIIQQAEVASNPRALNVVPALIADLGEEAAKERAGRSLRRCNGTPPLRRRFGSEDPKDGSRNEVALKIEVVVNGAMDAEEALCGSS
jgi:hypothetical protein